MKMKPEAVQEWRQRLAHADRYWEKQGMAPGGNRDSGAPDAFQYIEYYRGNQWPKWGWGGFNPEDLITVNVTFSNTNAFMSRISKRNPEVTATPKRKGSTESRRARINQLVLNYFLHELKMKREVDRALLDASLAPFGVVRHIFTPHIDKFDSEGKEIETYSQARPDLPGIKRYPFWDVRFDPTADSWMPDSSNTWVAFRDLLTMEQVKRHPRLTVREDLRPTKSVDLLSMEMRSNPQRDVGPDWHKLIEVWWIYEKIGRTWFAISPGSQKPLMDPAEWPIPWENLPYSFLAFNPQVDSNVPLPFPHTYASQQRELNKVETLMAELVKRLRRLVFMQRSGLTEADAAKIMSGDLSLQEVFLVDGALGDILKEVGIGGFDQTLMLYRAAIKEDIREQIGMSQMDRAQRINVESASEAVAVQAGSDTQSGRPEQVFEDFWQDIMRTFHQSLRYTLSDEILIPVVGLADREAIGTMDEFHAVSREDVDGEFNIDIRVGSTLPKDHGREFAKALQLKTLLVNDATVDQIELTRIVVEEAGFDSHSLVRSPEQVQDTEAILAANGQGGPPGGGKSKGQAGAGLDANLVRQLSPGAQVQ